MTETLSNHSFARPLSAFESYFAVTSATIWITDHVSGPLDLDTLQQAWDLLRRAHPVLTARLTVAPEDESVSGLRGLAIVVPAEPEPAPIGQIAEDALTLGAGEPVAKLRVAVDSGRARVALAFHHAITDGRLVQHWHHELWSYYTDLAAGRNPEVQSHPVPQSPEALLGERGIVKQALGQSRLAQAIPTNLPSGRSVNPILWRRVQLGVDDTAALLACAKRRGQTVHSLVAGVVALLTRRFLPVDHDRAVDINVVSPVDIRTRVEPPVPVWAGTNILGMANSVVAVQSDSDPIEVGAAVTEQLVEDLVSGVIHQSFLHMADTVDKPRPLVPRTLTTNLGVIGDIPLPAGLEILEARNALRFDWAPVIALMEATGQTDHPLLRTSVHIIHTYRGNLSIDFSTYLTAERAESYSGAFEALLLGMAARGPAQ
ncbi:hypothetical protein ABZ319_14915 [Nocardia sp. NPDC005978]|uniref:phthiocerol/phthiodiolone dimycocerosyl transferase family protein n=1 Tax=Nocardia sp. NPDC005978 TaxID=3156725 RepID=UPI0033B06B3E